jgi:hypothetical protein
MPYLDTGVVVQTIYIIATAFNFATCFVNPNIRVKNKGLFNNFVKPFKIVKIHNDYNIPEEKHLKFCGCMVIGKL